MRLFSWRAPAILLALLLFACASDLDGANNQEASAEGRRRPSGTETLTYIQLDRPEVMMKELLSSIPFTCTSRKYGKETEVQQCVDKNSPAGEKRFLTFVPLANALLVRYSREGCVAIGIPGELEALSPRRRKRGVGVFMDRFEPHTARDIVSTAIYLHEAHVETQVVHDILKGTRKNGDCLEAFATNPDGPPKLLNKKMILSRLAVVKKSFSKEDQNDRSVVTRVETAENVIGAIDSLEIPLYDAHGPILN